MPYSVLVVDDEPASIRYIKNLIAQYLPRFAVAGEAFSGLDAMEVLKRGMVDLLVTDARMPGMDGIELARAARAMSTELKIVVVSGYADFEYAKGALSAGVNEYLLKPLNIERTVEVLRGVEAKLDAEYAAARRSALGRLALGHSVESEALERYLGAGSCSVALVRHGNLPTPRGASGGAALPSDGELIVLPGRDEMEWIGIRLGGGDLREEVARLAAAHMPGEAATIVLCPHERPVGELHEIVRALTRTLDASLVMGRAQTIELPACGAHRADSVQANIPPNELRKMEFFLQSGNLDALKEQLFGHVVDWETRALPQRVVEGLVHQIVERALASIPQAQARRADVLGEVEELFLYARNAGELMSGLWDVLFAPLQASQSRQPQADELIREICDYLRECFAEPITMQLVCVRFGVSQTYLSRLFRKHEGTTFNDYLTRCRLDAAKRMIREQPGAKLRDVAALCGYEDSSYFSKVFRQHEGITPQQFAATLGNQAD